jgi:hypothetical protein
MGYVPERDATIVVLVNLDSDNGSGGPADDIVKLIAQEVGLL